MPDLCSGKRIQYKFEAGYCNHSRTPALSPNRPAARFQLTDREIEAVQHLADGLTSKEIAQRMNISPNTVKVFLRLVMLKMGVTTRSGVIGKLMSDAQLGYEWTNGDTMR